MTASGAATADPALQKLFNVMGKERGQALIDETMRRAGLRSLATPRDRLRFAKALMARGGLYEAMGRAIKIQAILLGAEDDD